MPAYRPWQHSQRQLGLALLTTAVSATVCYRTHTIMSGAIAAGFAALSVLIYRSVRRRRFGQQFETSVSREAARTLAAAGYAVERNRLFFGGDIDLIIKPKKARYRIPVEIKSFRRCHTGSRETRAMDQVLRQMRYLKSPTGILWLPQGYGTATDRHAATTLAYHYPAVQIVFGGVDALIQALRAIPR